MPFVEDEEVDASSPGHAGLPEKVRTRNFRLGPRARGRGGRCRAARSRGRHAGARGAPREPRSATSALGAEVQEYRRQEYRRETSSPRETSPPISRLRISPRISVTRTMNAAASSSSRLAGRPFPDGGLPPPTRILRGSRWAAAAPPSSGRAEPASTPCAPSLKHPRKLCRCGGGGRCGRPRRRGGPRPAGRVPVSHAVIETDLRTNSSGSELDEDWDEPLRRGPAAKLAEVPAGGPVPRRPRRPASPSSSRCSSACSSSRTPRATRS